MGLPRNLTTFDHGQPEITCHSQNRKINGQRLIHIMNYISELNFVLGSEIYINSNVDQTMVIQQRLA